MPKVDINKVAEVAKRNEVEPKVLRQILEELNMLAQVEETEKEPAIKKQFVILISDPDSLLPANLDFAGWVLQIPENESVATTQDRIIKAAEMYNTTRKGRLYPAKTIGEALECVKAGFFKENHLWVKTKTPVLMLRTDNEIPNPDQGKLFK